MTANPDDKLRRFIDLLVANDVNKYINLPGNYCCLLPTMITKVINNSSLT